MAIFKHVGAFFLTLAAPLAFANGPLDGHQQLIVVTTRNWEDLQGSLQLFERGNDHCPWIPVSQAVPVVVGKAGLAWGIGLHPQQDSPLVKVEGDKKSPAGVFSIGTAFGFANRNEMGSLKIDYLPLQTSIEAVDDPESEYYNCIVDNQKITPDWKSSEKMASISLYDLGFVINHNFPNPKPGFGSAIFFHLWRNAHSGTWGCTATEADHLKTIVSWLDKEKHPVLAQLPIGTYCELASSWGLPKL